MLFAMSHSFVYQNLGCSFHLFILYFFLVQMQLACLLAGSLLIIPLCIKICDARFICLFCIFYWYSCCFPPCRLVCLEPFLCLSKFVMLVLFVIFIVFYLSNGTPSIFIFSVRLFCCRRFIMQIN